MTDKKVPWILGMLVMMLSHACAADATALSSPVPEHPLLADELIVTLGMYHPRSTTSASLAPPSGAGGLMVSFEDTLGLEKTSVVPSLGVFWRVSEQWRVDIQYFDVSREATRTLDQDVEWGDIQFPAGSTADSAFDFTDIRAVAAYSFFRRPDKELGAGIGLHVSDIRGAIAASGVGAETADITAPLPVLNLYGMFSLTDEWAISMRADWLSLSYGDYSGDLHNLELNAFYQPFRHVGVGLSMRSMAINVDVDDDDWNGQARLGFQGPSAFVTISF